MMQRTYLSQDTAVELPKTVLNPASNVFIEAVIAKAKKKFIPANQYMRNLKDKFEQSPKLKEEYQKKYYIEHRFVSIKNEPFVGNATRIPGTNFIAAAGPQEHNLSSFIMDTAYHPQTPIHQVVALGECLSYENLGFYDFHDYCLKEREINAEPFHISVKRISGVTETSMHGDQIYPRGIVRAELHIDQNKPNSTQLLNVTVFELRDGKSIHLENNEKNEDQERTLEITGKTQQELYDEKKEAMWQIFQKSLQEPVLVHCTAGVGRTGHFILTMEILKSYTNIFAGNNPVVSAAKIHDILNNMRQVRWAMVFNEDQFVSAIQNANTLYRYALEKKYIQTIAPIIDKKEVVTPISIFSPHLAPKSKFSLLDCNDKEGMKPKMM